MTAFNRRIDYDDEAAEIRAALKIVHAVNGITDLGAVVAGPKEEPYVCDCHERMGNDFYFLPVGSCLHREDGVCNKRTEWRKPKTGEKA